MCPHFSPTRKFIGRKTGDNAIYYYEKHTMRKVYLEDLERQYILRDEYRMRNKNYINILEQIANGTLRPQKLGIDM